MSDKIKKGMVFGVTGRKVQFMVEDVWYNSFLKRYEVVCRKSLKEVFTLTKTDLRQGINDGKFELLWG